MVDRTNEQLFRTARELQESGDLPSAVTQFKTLIEKDDSDPRYWIAFAHCLIRLSHWRQAAKAFQAGIDRKPHYAEADARVAYAEVLLKLKETRMARKQLEHVLTMTPFYPSHDRPMNEARKLLATLD